MIDLHDLLASQPFNFLEWNKIYLQIRKDLFIDKKLVDK